MKIKYSYAAIIGIIAFFAGIFTMGASNHEVTWKVKVTYLNGDIDTVRYSFQTKAIGNPKLSLYGFIGEPCGIEGYELLESYMMPLQ